MCHIHFISTHLLQLCIGRSENQNVSVVLGETVHSNFHSFVIFIYSIHQYPIYLYNYKLALFNIILQQKCTNSCIFKMHFFK